MKFGTQAVKVGDTFTGDYTAKVDVLHAVDGIPTEKAHENRMFHSSYEMTVTELDRELPETVRVRYTGGREYILSEGDLEDDDHEHLGDALIASEGSYERPGGGGLSDRHDALVLDGNAHVVGAAHLRRDLAREWKRDAAMRPLSRAAAQCAQHRPREELVGTEAADRVAGQQEDEGVADASDTGGARGAHRHAVEIEAA
ncbi:MAG: hypothetical protein AAF721_28340, partial [Myxococcota bacterium]